MSRYSTRRHRHLMDESEQGLLDAHQSDSERKSGISGQILSDTKLHLLWESRHAKLMLPVAEHRKTTHQIINLRLASMQMIHGRALIEYVRDHEIRGEERRRFFAQYFGLMDYQNAVLAAHRHYLLSMSSMVSTNHLIDLMFDPVSHALLARYHDVYRKYFELSAYAASAHDDVCARALWPFIQREKIELNRIRKRLVTTAPDMHCRELDRQACLARSGRYPVLNYLLA